MPALLKRLLAILAMLGGVMFVEATLALSARSSSAVPSGTVNAIIGLKHPAGLAAFVKSVSDPASRNYRHYVSVEQLARRYGASAKARTATVSWLRRNGLRGLVSPTGAFITVRSIPHEEALRLFGVAGATASVAAYSAPVPAALRSDVTGVGLVGAAAQSVSATDPVARTASVRGRAAGDGIIPDLKGCDVGTHPAPPNPNNPELVSTPPGFSPNALRDAYGFSALRGGHGRALTGRGQTVAILSGTDYVPENVASFGECFGIKVPPITRTLVDTARPPAVGEEIALDIDVLLDAAPGVSRIEVYEAPRDWVSILDMLGASLGRGRSHPNVISISFGNCENDLYGQLAVVNGFENVELAAAGAGISIVVSAGDYGSSNCQATGRVLPLLAAEFPASLPTATAVGGTTLALNANNHITQQAVWKSPITDLGAPGGAGGGGVSMLTADRPWWQRGPAFRKSPVGRLLPDISALADPDPAAPGQPGGYTICDSEDAGLPCEDLGFDTAGGVSAATPLVAGAVVVMDEDAQLHGQPPLGFLNPLIYQLGQSKARATVFDDVTQGTNDIGDEILQPNGTPGKPLGCCTAGPGYDEASGWGSLKVAAFSKAAIRAARRSAH